MDKTCVIEGCEAAVLARSWCRPHYMAKYYRGEFGPRGSKRPRGTAEELLWRKIDKRVPGECWPWTGSRDPKGYGKAKIKKRSVSAHRMAYELSVGPIPDGYEIDHLCRNTSCCNPAHLEAVTPAENMRRRSIAQTHCKRGHEFTPENTYLVGKDKRRRQCRACTIVAARRHDRARRARIKAERGPLPPRPLKTHCKSGHPYDEKNTYWYSDRRGFDRRGCRQCRQHAAERWKQKAPSSL